MLSGSYQQAIPRYISTDNKGNDEKEFLNDYFPDIKTLTKAIFLKGYQWPFDPEKIAGYGSSLIDLLVFREITDKGRNVYLDYTKNPSFGISVNFTLKKLDSEVYEYLSNSGALKNSPLERLLALNAPAFSLYKEHGIDLSSEPLQIAVCAQHNNGGLKANIWWESDLKHLFPVGEVNGSHGVCRPGGSALNSGQVGSYRAAKYISKLYNQQPPDTRVFMQEAKEQIVSELDLAKKWLTSGTSAKNRKYSLEIKKRMSEAGGIIRDIKKVTSALAAAENMMKHINGEISAGSVKELAESYLLTDNCLTHYIYLDAIKTYLEKGGRSRGSYLVLKGEKSRQAFKPDLCQYDRNIENDILEISLRNGKIFRKLVKVRELPAQDLWFEKVWKDYLEDNYIGC
jgi:succinate dehydrogenase/fumarate reductase flavoprotein subunit